MECDSAHTSVTTALMSMAMASIMKVFLMSKKEGKGYNGEAKWKTAAGEEEEKWSKVGWTLGTSGRTGMQLLGRTWEKRPVLYACTMAVRHL